MTLAKVERTRPRQGDPMSNLLRRWQPGLRHQVHITAGHDPKAQRYRYAAWQCVNWRQWFDRWPQDDVTCPGPDRPVTVPEVHP